MVNYIKENLNVNLLLATMLFVALFFLVGCNINLQPDYYEQANNDTEYEYIEEVICTDDRTLQYFADAFIAEFGDHMYVTRPRFPLLTADTYLGSIRIFTADPIRTPRNGVYGMSILEFTTNEQARAYRLVNYYLHPDRSERRRIIVNGRFAASADLDKFCDFFASIE